jgi:capsid protein
VSDIEADWEGEDENVDRPYGGRPYGGRPYGGRPYGGRPYGGRPYGGRPYGGRPYGARLEDEKPYGGRPYGGRPYGGRPYGGRPYGGRPYGGRPYGGRPYGGRRSAESGIDIDEWSADVGDIFCERSAVVRLGATLVASEDALPVGAFDAEADFRVPGGAVPAPATVVGGGPAQLRPGDWMLEAGIVVEPELRRALAADPELAVVLKVDLADALARRADEAFLQGAGPPGPAGIEANGLPAAAGADLLATGRQVLLTVRPVPAIGPPPVPAPVFGAPGWVLASNTLDALTVLQTPDGLGEAAGRSLDSYRLLQLDGVDGGQFLGYPFLLSAGAAPGNLYFGTDWREALVGIDPSFVSVWVSAEPPPAGDGFVVRASVALDFALRRPNAFAWA